MTGTVLLYDPTAPAAAATTTIAPAFVALAGKVVGFIDNSKPNFAQLVDDLGAILVRDHGVARVIVRRKRAASVPAPAEVIDELARTCDVVVAGSGD